MYICFVSRLLFMAVSLLNAFKLLKKVIEACVDEVLGHCLRHQN